jgi:hypothetical protein
MSCSVNRLSSTFQAPEEPVAGCCAFDSGLQRQGRSIQTGCANPCGMRNYLHRTAYFIESFEMTNLFFGALMALSCSSCPTFAERPACVGQGCNEASFTLTSTADQARYGLLFAAASDMDCASVQFVVVAARRGVVGQSGVLRPGDVQVARIGRGYAPGEHALTIFASGCQTQAFGVRRVRFGKPSPDHGWRAAAFVQAAFTP